MEKLQRLGMGDDEDEVAANLEVTDFNEVAGPDAGASDGERRTNADRQVLRTPLMCRFSVAMGQMMRGMAVGRKGGTGDFSGDLSVPRTLPSSVWPAPSQELRDPGYANASSIRAGREPLAMWRSMLVLEPWVEFTASRASWPTRASYRTQNELVST
jgi:hypothetical protein